MGASNQVIQQTELTECGLACLAMAANELGHDVDLGGLRQRFRISANGTSLASLMEMADSLTLSSRPLRLEPEHLGQLQTPAILHWDMSHYVVFDGLKGGKAIIRDPAHGRRLMAMSELSRHFTGVALELTRADDFKKVQARQRLKLSDLWSNFSGLKRALAYTLGLSVLLQLTIIAIPFFLQLVIDEAVPRSDIGLLTSLALAFAAIAVMRAVTESLRAWAILYYGNHLTFQMTGNILRHLLRLPAGYFESRHVGDIISRMGSTQPIQRALTQGVVAAIIDGLMAIIMGVILILYSLWLALIVFAAMALIFAATWWAYPRLKARQEDTIVTRANEQSHVIESIRAFMPVKLFGREVEREAAWRNLYSEHVDANLSYGRYQIALSFVKTLVGTLQLIAVVYVGARLIMAGDAFTVGMLFAFLAYRQQFTDSLTKLVDRGLEFRLLSLHLERISDVALTETEAAPKAASEMRDMFTGDIRLDNVSFQYSPSDPVVLKNLSLHIEPGEFVALTGPSGQGKTTLMKLMLGLYAPTSGSIFLGEKSLNGETLRVWRKHVGVVMQNDALLSGTIKDNICFFDAEPDMARIQGAAAAAQIHDFIQSLPMGYDSLIGDMGSSLSGGQKQRILLARALYHRPPVLFLDEGTANLDQATERKIADLLKQLKMTRVVIAHSETMLSSADRVIEITGKDQTPD